MQTEIPSAAALRRMLWDLEDEREAARAAGLEANRTYMAELREDLRVLRQAYVEAAVTEIAVLRAGLGGPLEG